MATTENITVLFTDLVGSTQLVSSLTPEAGHEVRRKHFSALRQAIATTGGTEVKSLGDGLMVVFPIASAALGCAVAMQQAVHRDNHDADRPLGLRVGLGAGEATRENDDYFGDPVVEAARLCAKADSGQILITDLVRGNAGRRSTHSFTSLGALELKGLPEPIETFEVGWQPLAVEEMSAERVPLPERFGHRPGVGVIGREHELAALETAAKAVASGEGRQIILISGEPGQGKTTLVSELARRVAESHATVLLGRCDEEVGAPYRPFAEAISHYVAYAPEIILRSHVGDHGGELARMVPALQKRLGDLPPQQSTDPDTERYLVYGAMAGLLESACFATPVLLVLEDLHWADKPSLQLLRHLIANTSSARLLIIGTYRDAELSASHPLTDALAALHRELAGVSSIELKGLDDTGVIAFMESAAGHSLDDAGVGLAHQVYRETDGNPFFVGELLRELAESGAIYQDTATGRWTASDDERNLVLPHSVRIVIGTRVSRLGEEATKVLSTAAVIGRDFDLDLLVETTKFDEETLIDLMDEAQRAALVTEVSGTPGRYCFSHALVQHTLYEDLGASRRTVVHRSVGEAIERLYGEQTEGRVGELARHFLLATRPTDAQKAMVYAHRAGEAALKGLAPDEAVRYFSQALELASQSSLTDSAVRTKLLVDLGTAQRQAGIASFRETLLEAAAEARRAGETDLLVAAALANHRGFVTSVGVIDEEKIAVLEAALAALPEADSPNRARLMATLCSELTFASLDRRLPLFRESIAMARRLGDPATFVDVVFTGDVAVRIPRIVEEQLANLEEALPMAIELDDPLALFWISAHLMTASIRAARFEGCDKAFQTMVGIAERLRQPMLRWIVAFWRVALALLHGELDGIDQLAEAALAIGTEAGQPDAFVIYGSQLFGIRKQQGRLSELRELIAQIAEETPGTAVFTAALSVASLESGDDRSARAILEEASQGGFDLNEDPTYSTALAEYARAAIALRLEGTARQLVEHLQPWPDEIVTTGVTVLSPFATYLGGLCTVLGRYADAETYFARAAHLCSRGAMRWAEADNNVLWASMLRQRGRPGDFERARQLLGQARESAISNGYATVERQVAEELSKLS